MLEVAASVGIAVFGEHGEDADALLQHADVAMYLAKGAHAGNADSAEQDTNDAEPFALAGAKLRRAIEENVVLPAEGRPPDCGSSASNSMPDRATPALMRSSRSPSAPA